MLYCTVDTSRVVEEDAEKAAPGAIRAIVEKEMRAINGQSSWRCRAVTRDTKNTNRIKIVCRDESEHTDDQANSRNEDASRRQSIEG